MLDTSTNCCRRHSWYNDGQGLGRWPCKSLENFLDVDGEDSDEDIATTSATKRNVKNGRPTLYILKQNLMRSPSDSSLMYINQVTISCALCG